MCATVSGRRESIDAPCVSLSLLQSSHLGLARAPIMCSHCPHGKEHVITCLALLFLASGTAPDLIHEPNSSLLSPSLSKNSAAQVVVVGLFQFSYSLPPALGIQLPLVPLLSGPFDHAVVCFTPLLSLHSYVMLGVRTVHCRHSSGSCLAFSA